MYLVFYLNNIISICDSLDKCHECIGVHSKFNKYDRVNNYNDIPNIIISSRNKVKNFKGYVIEEIKLNEII